MVRDIIEDTSTFPIEYATDSYWHYHLPISQIFIDSKHTPRSIRRLCLQTLIDRADFLSKHKPIDCHVMCIIDLPDIWGSILKIYFDEGYYQNFLAHKNTPWEKWTPIYGRDIAQEFHLSVPDNFCIKGYKEEGYDDNDTSVLIFSGEQWVIGEIQ
jgi:hypothetical protein